MIKYYEVVYREKGKKVLSVSDLLDDLQEVEKIRQQIIADGNKPVQLNRVNKNMETI